MKTKIPYLILALIIFATQPTSAALTTVYTEDFNPAVVPDATGSGLQYFNGSADEYWIGPSNLVNYSGDLTLDGQGLSGGRGRGAVVWLDPSSWPSDRTIATIAFDVSGYTAIGGAETYFRAFYGNSLGGGNTAGFDVHQGFGVDIDTNANGALAEMGSLSGKGLVTGNGSYTFSFDYSTADWVALAFYTSGEVASFDNIVITVPEPSSTALLGLGLSSMLLRRRRS